MDLITKAVLHYLKTNPGTLLDVMITLGEELENQPKEKKERFLSLLEKKIRERVKRLEQSNRTLQKKVARLECVQKEGRSVEYRKLYL